MGISLSLSACYPFDMGKKVVNEDYAKPLFTRIYRKHRKMLDELVLSFPLIKIKYPRKDGPQERQITDTEVVQVAIEKLHHRRVIAPTKQHGTRHIHNETISPDNT